jgi:aerobic C4-dicarboxylate transport protein
MALILGIDRFMSEARALVNVIGNGVATIVISRTEGELDLVRLNAALDGKILEAMRAPAALNEIEGPPLRAQS